MLHFKARRRNPTASPQLTASQRRIMKIMADAMAEVRAQVIRDEAQILDVLRHGPESKLPNMVSDQPWYDAQPLIEKELLSELIDAGKRTGAEFPRIQKATLSYRFDAERPDSAAWAQKEAGNLIREVAQEQVTMVRDYVSRSQMGEFTVTQVARNLRDVVGLTTQQSGWVDNYRSRFIQDRMSKGDSLERAIEAAAKPTERYQARIHKYRTETIARTEILRASNEGRNQAWQQGIEEGYISPAAQKQWVAEFDACEICLPLDGISAPISGSFAEGDPPLHPNCRCDVIMVDVDVTEYEDMSWDEIDAVLDELLEENRPAMPAEKPNSVEGFLNDADNIVMNGLRRDAANGDGILQELYERTNKNNLPTLGKPGDLDASIAKGGIEVFRGIFGENADKYISEFKTGPHFAGRGVFGHGTYTAVDRRVALDYGGGIDSNVMRIVIKPNTRFMPHSEAEATSQTLWMENYNKHNKRVQELNDRGASRAELQENLEQYERRQLLVGDPSYVAIMNGYDGIVKGSGDEAYFIVFDRSKLIVQN